MGGWPCELSSALASADVLRLGQPRSGAAGARRSRRFNGRMELSAGFVLDAPGVRTVKRAEARAPAADSVTMRFVRISICRIFLRTSRGIMP